MPGLLSNQQITDIRASLKLVTDTFFTTQVVYRRYGESADPWGEDRRGNQAFDDHVIAGMVEYPKDSAEQTQGGAVEKADVKVTFNMDDLDTDWNLLTPEKLAVFSVKDELFVNGRRYRISSVYYDGPLEPKNVLCVVEGKLQEKNG